jgi:hypothetical protein
MGLGILLHEVLIAPEPRYLSVITGLILLGVPVDAAIGVLSGRRDDGPPEPPPGTPPKPPLSPDPSSTGSSSTSTERAVDAT